MIVKFTTFFDTCFYLTLIWRALHNLSNSFFKVSKLMKNKTIIFKNCLKNIQTLILFEMITFRKIQMLLILERYKIKPELKWNI